MLLAANLGAMIFDHCQHGNPGIVNYFFPVLAPLKDKNLISRAILANFILVPVLAWLLVTGLHLPAALRWTDSSSGRQRDHAFPRRANQIHADKRELAGRFGSFLPFSPFSIFRNWSIPRSG